jgi:hypothetical protein
VVFFNTLGARPRTPGSNRGTNFRQFIGRSSEFIQTDHGNRGRQVVGGLEKHAPESGFDLKVHGNLHAPAQTLLWTWKIEISSRQETDDACGPTG